MKISWNLATGVNFMFRLLIWAFKPASFITDFSVLCRLYLCIFRDHLNTLKDLHFNGYIVLTKGSAKKLPTSLLLLLLSLPPVNCQSTMQQSACYIPCHKIPYLQCIFLCQSRGTVVVSRQNSYCN